MINEEMVIVFNVLVQLHKDPSAKNIAVAKSINDSTIVIEYTKEYRLPDYHITSKQEFKEIKVDDCEDVMYSIYQWGVLFKKLDVY